MLSKNLQKTFAVFTLAGFLATGVGFSVSEAASRPAPDSHKTAVTHKPAAPRKTTTHRVPPPQNQGGLRNYRPVHNDNRRPAPPRREKDRDSGSTTGNLVTGLIIGGILGHVITNNS